MADDEEINRLMLKKILDKEYEVLLASDGDEALRIIRSDPSTLSIVLLDLMMPGTDGFGVISAMKEDPLLQSIPVIVLTSEKKAEVKSLRMGAADFIPKPYDIPEVILARIDRTIALFENREMVSATQHDSLTGLYSKEFFMEYANKTDQYYPDRDMDCIAVNINRFHVLNDLYGRDFGDRILKIVGEVLKKYAGSRMGIACRYSADGFFIYIPHSDSYEDILKEIGEGVPVVLYDISSRIRIGVYQFADRSLDIHKRFDCALLACNSIRREYSVHVAYYDTSMREREAHMERLTSDMEKALSEKQFIVYYQPKFNVEGENPVLSSAEALIRWKHPEFGMVSPGEFIPIFEENGMIRRLDRYVWKEAARQVAEWKKLFNKSVPVSVNVSRIDLMEPDFVREITGILRDAGISPSEYLLEVTESAYTEDSVRIIEVVKELRSLGFKIEMDDFGTGYSSLNMLSSLPIDVLKLDIGFTRYIHENKKDLRMVELIIDIAKYLELTVVAEGVESREQYLLLKDAGVNVIQGFYFSRPLPSEEFTKLF